MRPRIFKASQSEIFSIKHLCLRPKSPHQDLEILMVGLAPFIEAKCKSVLPQV